MQNTVGKKDKQLLHMLKWKRMPSLSVTHTSTQTVQLALNWTKEESFILFYLPSVFYVVHVTMEGSKMFWDMLEQVKASYRERALYSWDINLSI